MDSSSLSLKNELKKLEETGLYVFHGSPDGDIEVLEPRQGSHIPDLSKRTETILDGSPAVSATPYLDFAIFRAIINVKNVHTKFNSGFGFKNGKKEFRVSSLKVLEEIKGKNGFVYVFNKNEFEPYSRDGQPHPGNMEWRSYQSVKPIKVIEVSFEDLVDHSLIEIQ